MACSETPEDMVKTLLEKSEIFQRLFNQYFEYINLQPQEQATAEEIFRDTFPNYNSDLKTFFNEWVVQKLQHTINESEDITPSETCSQLVYDGGTKSYLNARVLPPLNRKKRLEKFNLGEFVRQKRLNGDFHQITYNDRESVEDLMDELNEEKQRNDQKADIALNRIVEMVAILNANCKYRLLELHSERRIQ
ncbi:uncharacterized protein TNIN_395301 [Trichonephila inaurata madagascariensis]|uniref:Uncharacterized protein n=2 Tax=Trichonephila inaurata madagascariensis TaxID=2747483 RepID=A0A8X6YQ88_9ARAC|nr:uncharacterized protein TNIN_395301 [Trichonephila inaurata madagascariensis]